MYEANLPENTNICYNQDYEKFPTRYQVYKVKNDEKTFIIFISIVSGHFV